MRICYKAIEEIPFFCRRLGHYQESLAVPQKKMIVPSQMGSQKGHQNGLLEVWSLLEESLMPWTDRQMNSSLAGALKRGIRAHLAEVGVSSYPVLRMSRFHSASQAL